jgi:hypothetical protein
MTIVPYTEMLDLYWNQRKHCTLTGTQAWIKQPEAAARQLAERFERSVAMFTSYENEREPFHQTATAKGFAPKLRRWEEGEALGRGSRYAAALIAGAQVPHLPPGVTYVDRELDCLRTNKGKDFSGTEIKTKRAVVPDLLLCDADGFPIVAEVKTRSDKNAIYALVTNDRELDVYAAQADATLAPLEGLWVVAMGKLVDLSGEGFGEELWLASIDGASRVD